MVIVFVGVPLPRQSVEGLLFKRRLRQAKGGFCFEQTFKPAHANGNNWAGSRRGTTGKPISASALALPKAVGPLSTQFPTFALSLQFGLTTTCTIHSTWCSNGAFVCSWAAEQRAQRPVVQTDRALSGGSDAGLLCQETTHD